MVDLFSTVENEEMSVTLSIGEPLENVEEVVKDPIRHRFHSVHENFVVL